jgi:hypothetical protein
LNMNMRIFMARLLSVELGKNPIIKTLALITRANTTTLRLRNKSKKKRKRLRRG